MKQQLELALQKTVNALLAEYGVEATVGVRLSRPKLKEHGDYAANVAMPLAGRLGMKPAEIAERLLAEVSWPETVAEAQIAAPGFINIRLHEASETDVIKQVLRQKDAFGLGVAASQTEKICLEFVSANPTGPMHVGHGRGAVVGDALASVLSAVGHDVHREYYINDAGAQIGVLANSVWLRMQEIQGVSIELPESAYPGDYIIDIAHSILQNKPYADWLAMSDEDRLSAIGELAVAENMTMIRADLARLNISFDHYFSEKSLHADGKVHALIEKLRQDDLVYTGTLPPPKGKEVDDYVPVEQELFRTTAFGDDVDRPLQKQDGTATYFAADIAYHDAKHLRGYDRLIDIWGADHGGYVTRVQAAMKALTGKDNQPEVLLVQMVNLTRDGKPVRMSKRAGTFVTLNEVVEEVGSDAVRFNFLTRRAESQLDFDLEAAKQRNDENPVYYVQYAHARVCAILRRAQEEGVQRIAAEQADLSPLSSDEEQQLIAQMLAYPEILAKAAQRREPYRVATYLLKLAQCLHGFYHKQRVIVDDEALMQARLLLVESVGQVIRNGLRLLGVSAPESM